MKVDHTRDMVRLSMLDSVADSNDGDDYSCFEGSVSGGGGEGAAVQRAGGEGSVGAGGGVEDVLNPRTPSVMPPSEALTERVTGLGPGEGVMRGVSMFRRFFFSFFRTCEFCDCGSLDGGGGDRYGEGDSHMACVVAETHRKLVCTDRQLLFFFPCTCVWRFRCCYISIVLLWIFFGDGK